ncbi:MAG TPA: hypothetical protein VKR56_06365 [Candidatus Cybelea sp.]|nr:hypothetical protein [Candidatus Cybelea sp.]
MRHTARIALVAILALFEITAAAVSIASFQTPIGTYGFLLSKDVTFAEVDPTSLTARAGVVAGDRLLYETLPLRGRRFAILNEEVPGGAPIAFAIVHDGKSRWVTLRATDLLAIGQTESLTYAIAGLAMGIVGLVLVLLRPSRMTWAFALIAPALVLPFGWLFWAQQSAGTGATLFDVFVALVYATQPAAIMIFASRFPNDRPTGMARLVDRLALPAGAAIAGLYLYAYLEVRYSHAPPVHLFSLYDLSVVIPGLAALIALVSTYVTIRGAARSRLVPVIGSFALLILADVLQQLVGQHTTNNTVTFTLALLFSLSPALIAVSVAYGIIRHRVMDVNFIISRTLVYTILTLGAVALFTLIEYVFGRVLEHQGVATILNILAAVGLGVSFNLLHRHLDEWIDRFLFKQRHLAEQRLAAVARALPHASTAAAIEAALVDDPAATLGLSSAAVFRHGKSAYERVRAHAWTDDEATELDADDALALRLRADLVAVDPNDLRWPRTDLPSGDRQVIYAVPIVVGHHLEAIALYGGHLTGEDLDPGERSSLRRLAAAASAGYDHIATVELRTRLRDAESENATLRGVERKLTELLAQRLQP